MMNSEDTPGLHRHVALVGLMGVGKTTVGRRLAKRVGAAFRDADEEVEIAAGRTVAEIFADFGEPAFREGERKVIARLLEEDTPMIIGLGGGAFINEDTRSLIKSKAVSVWLRADLDVLVERVARKPGARPLLNEGDPRTILERLLKDRAPIYAQADIIVDSTDGSHEESAEQVLKALSDFEQEIQE